MRCIFFVLFFAFSCATDGPQDENNGTRKNPNGCANPCSAGQTRCVDTVVQACAADNKGCFNWVDGLDCAEDSLLCDASTNPAICLSEPGTCDDGAKNQDESDVDCGGLRCSACQIGKTCEAASDCESENCDTGGTQTCVTPDTPTCSDNKKNQDESDIDCGGSSCEKCAKGEDCTRNEDCDSNTCDNGSCKEMETSCNQDAKRCLGNTVQICDTNRWVETQICAQMCDQGTCSDNVTCTAGENRCFKNSVQECNITGSAWQHLSICNEDCNQGLCVGACEPDSFRCNVNKKEVCNPNGMTWSEEETCANGCAQQTCIEDGLVNQGIPQTLSGTRVYSGCVKIELGGSLTIPAGETLEIFAKCLEITSSSSVTLENGARFIFHARENVLNEGTIAGGNFVKISAFLNFTNKGNISSEFVQLRGDNLLNESNASISGTTAHALYGSSWTNNGTHSGEVSVMPPVVVGSPTHPVGFWWNLNEDDVSVSWDKPFQSVAGYYVSVNRSEQPDPSNAEFTTSENLTLPLSHFRQGENTIQVVSVNADATVGTISESIIINFNTITPPLSSSTHTSSLWTASDDVFIEWDESPIASMGNSFVGYWYVWNHEGNTNPNAQNGTFRNDSKILLNDQAPGVWAFHLSLIDRLGRTSPYPAHYQVRIGSEPGYGNIAGEITDAAGNPIFGAQVKVNDGLFSAFAKISGEYTFDNTIPAAAFDYRIDVSAPGFLSQTQVLRLSAGQVELKNFQLQESPNPVAYQMGFEKIVASSSSPPLRSRLTEIAIGAGNNDIFSWGYGMGILPIDGQNPEYATTYTSLSYEQNIGFTGTHYFSSYYYYNSSAPSTRRARLAVWEPGSSLSYKNYVGEPTPLKVDLAWNGSKIGAFGSRGASLRFGNLDLSNASPDLSQQIDLGGVRSSALASLWDGSAYGLAVTGRINSTDELYFFKVSRDGNLLEGPIYIMPTSDQTAISIAFDGQKYYFAAISRDLNTMERSIRLASIDKNGTIKTADLLRNVLRKIQRFGDLIFDGKNLLAAHIENDEVKFSIIDKNTLMPTSTLNLGAGVNASIDYSFRAGRGAIVYESLDRQTLFHRSFYVK